MNDIEIEDINAQLPNELSLEPIPYINREALLNALEEKIIWAMRYNSGVFYQLMYKLDIDEKKLIPAMYTADIPKAIATLIIERQIQRIKSKKENPPSKAEDEELRW